MDSAALDPYLTAALAAVLVLYLAYALRPRAVMGYGSGSNSLWSRRIRTDRPVHNRVHHQLERAWVYMGAGGSADLRAVSRGLAAQARSGTDARSKAPLTGHLVGRQTWASLPAGHPLQGMQDGLAFDPTANVNAGDKLLRAQRLAAAGRSPALATPGAPRGAPSVTPQEALALGWDFYAALQCEDGHWAGDYGGPLFLLPGMVIAADAAGVALGDDRRSAMLTYTLNHQQRDGGWALHIEGPSTVFGTTMNYVAARLLGLPPGHACCVAARAFLHAHGGAIANPHWGKFWLAVVGACEWEAVNPIPPELWLLPRWFPFHPGKMWCHSRMPYLPMSYVYGARFAPHVAAAGVSPPPTPLAAALRTELYSAPYERVDWYAIRNTCADIDLYAPHTWLTEAAFAAFRAAERWAPSWLRRRARAAGLRFALEYCEAEDVATNFIDIGPVIKVVNMLVAAMAHGRDSPELARHVARLDDYLWVAEDGMKMQGYNGSQLWDTAFAAQAFVASRLAEAEGASGSASASGAAARRTARLREMGARAYAYLDATQIKEDVPQRERFFRVRSRGGWPFSTNDHGWPIADCTAEGLKAALGLQGLAAALELGEGESPGWGHLRAGLISPRRYEEAVDVILALHNPARDGGWATYEETRGGSWYEYLNPAEVFGDIMIDYTYTGEGGGGGGGRGWGRLA